MKEPEKAGASTLNLNIRYRLAGEIANGLQQIFLGKPGLDAKPSADDLAILVTAPRDVTKLVIADLNLPLDKQPCSFPNPWIYIFARRPNQFL